MRAIIVHGHRDPGEWCISEECVSRLDKALSLARPDDVIILTGGGDPSEAMQMSMGCYPYDYVTDGHARDTVDNVLNCSHLLYGVGATSALAVTSWWHVPRAQFLWNSHLTPVPVKCVGTRGSLRYLWPELRSWYGLLRRLLKGRPACGH